MNRTVMKNVVENQAREIVSHYQIPLTASLDFLKKCLTLAYMQGDFDGYNRGYLHGRKARGNER